MDLAFGGPRYELLRRHLRGRHEVEEVAFLFCRPSSDNSLLRVEDVRMLGAADFDVQTDFHIALADRLRPELIKRAWDTGTALVEAHSHVDGDPAGFSRSDLAGFLEWVPHMLWRLGGRPYTALVFGPETFDALVWTDEVDQPAPLGRIVVDESRVYMPTNLTLTRLRALNRDG